MGIGLGIVLLVLGLILVLDVVQFDIGFIDDQGLGWIFLIVGVLAIVLALVMNQQRSQHQARRGAPLRRTAGSLTYNAKGRPTVRWGGPSSCCDLGESFVGTRCRGSTRLREAPGQRRPDGLP